MVPASKIWLRRTAAITYSTAIGALVGGLFWQTFRPWLPPIVMFAVSGVLAIRVATLFASATAAGILHWRAIWIGGIAGVMLLTLWWPIHESTPSTAPPILLGPVLLAALIVAAAAETMPLRKGQHFYDSSRFARGLHFLQGVLLFGLMLPASLAWRWPRPYAIAVIVSAFVLWRAWDACPVTLAENEARAREGRPRMPPESGFIPDVFARFGVAVSGHTVGLLLYGVGLSLCGWFGLDWWTG